MTILNDVLTFEPSDIAQLSAELQTALDAYASPKPVEVVLSRIVNDTFRRAESKRVNTKIINIQKALVAATPAEKTAASDLLAQAATILKIQFLPSLQHLTTEKVSRKVAKL